MTNALLEEALLELDRISFWNQSLETANVSRERVEKVITVLSIKYTLELLAVTLEALEE